MSFDLMLNEGANTSTDRSALAPGELQQATGVFYRRGDRLRAHKLRGRTSFGDTGSAAKIKGVAVARFDTGGTDKLLAYSGTTIYGATPGASGSFSSLITGLNASGTHLTAVHSNDRWYLGNGYENKTLEADGTTRQMGMVAPSTQPTAVRANSSGTTTRPTATSGGTGWTNLANAYDSNETTFTHAAKSSAGSVNVTFLTWGASTRTSRTLRIKYALAGMQPLGDGETDDTDIGTGGTVDAGFNVDILIEYSQDGGTTWTNLVNRTGLKSPVTDTVAQVALTNGLDDANVRVRATLDYNSGTNQAVLRVYDVKITDGASGATFTTTTGMYYAYTEYDETHGNESGPSPLSALVHDGATAFNQVTLTLPAAASNASATHYRIYRTADGGAATIADLGRIATAPIAASYPDDFTFAKATVSAPLLAKVTVEVDGETRHFVRDHEPPAAISMTEYRGSLVFVQRDSRALYFSIPGRPESVPEINVITSFPMPEHDTLIGAAGCGDTLLILAAGVVMRMDELPDVFSGVFRASEVIPLGGAPGCVGHYGFTAFSVSGEPRVAWVSRYGIHVTNGFQTEEISAEMDWSGTVSVANLSTAVLRFDPEHDVLIFAYPSGSSGNDRYALFHMAPEHQKQSGQPKWTGPHYGAISDLVVSEISGQQRMYSGHWTDGKVYLEKNGGTDASQAYSGTTLPLIVKTRRAYDGSRMHAASRGRLLHTDFGTGQNCTLAWECGRDSASGSQTVTKTVALAGQKGTDFMVGRSGDWHEATITHTGEASAGAALQGLMVFGYPQGDVGKIVA